MVLEGESQSACCPKNIHHAFLCQPRTEGYSYRYLRYRPDSSLWAMISILPSPTWEIWMVSPRLPTRPSTLIFSFRNFSKAETSKILSLAGCEALMTNCKGAHRQRCDQEWDFNLGILLTFLVVLEDLPFFCDFEKKNDLSLLHHAMISLAERLGQQQSGVKYVRFGEPLLLISGGRGRKEVKLSCAVGGWFWGRW